MNVDVFCNKMEQASPLGKVKLIESLEPSEITPLEDFFRAVAQYLNSPSEYVRGAVSRFIAVKFPLEFVFDPLIGVIVRDPVFWPAKQAAAMAFCRAPIKQIKPLLNGVFPQLSKPEQDELTEVLNSAGAREVLECIQPVEDQLPEHAEAEPEPLVEPVPDAQGIENAADDGEDKKPADQPEAVVHETPPAIEPEPVVEQIPEAGPADGEPTPERSIKAEQTRRLKVLLSSLTNLDIDLSSEIAFSLSNYSGDELMDNLITLLHKQKSSFSRAILVQIVGMLENPKAVELLLPYLKDEDRRVRANAVEAVGSLGGEKYARVLLPLLEDTDNRVRANTARALWEFGGLRAVNILMNMLNDPRKWIRASGAYALGEIGVIHVIEPLLKAIDDPDIDVRINVIRALGKTHDISVSKPLMRLVIHVESPKDVRIAALDSLEHLSKALGQDFLSQLLEEPLLPDVIDRIKKKMARRNKIILE